MVTTLPLPPAPKGHFLMGGLYHFASNPLKFLSENIPAHKGVFRVTTPLGLKIMVVSEPEYVKYILQDNNRNYTKSFGYQILKLLLGEGLLTSEGDFWRRQRRLAQPAFHREKLAALVNTMTSCTAESITRLEKQAGNGVINIASEMMALTLDIVAQALFSADVKDAISAVEHELSKVNESAMERIHNPMRLPQWVPTPANRRDMQSVKKLDAIVLGIIERRHKSMQEHSDLLGMLMSAVDEETGEKMSDLQLRDEVMTIFLAGHETTAVALSWLWYLLHINPDKALLLQQEIDTVLNGRVPTIEDIPNLQYTRQVIDETLRLYPPGWLVGRRTIDADEIGGYQVPALTNIVLPVYHIHHDARWWDAPEEFRPERFQKEKMKDMPRFAYLPFGGGPRLCIGNNFALMEMQIIVAMMVQRFHFRIPAGHVPQMDMLITLRPKNGMPVNVEVR
jgi:cytochrome P450